MRLATASQHPKVPSVLDQRSRDGPGPPGATGALREAALPASPGSPPACGFGAGDVFPRVASQCAQRLPPPIGFSAEVPLESGHPAASLQGDPCPEDPSQFRSLAAASLPPPPQAALFRDDLKPPPHLTAVAVVVHRPQSELSGQVKNGGVEGRQAWVQDPTPIRKTLAENWSWSWIVQYASNAAPPRPPCVTLGSDPTPVGLGFLTCMVRMSTARLNCDRARNTLSTGPRTERSPARPNCPHYCGGEGARTQESRPGRAPTSAPGAERSSGSSGRGDSSGSGLGSRPAQPRAHGPRAPTPPPRLPGASGAPAARLTLKFLAVLLAAGMLAFLGAVICIIASVPLAASPARALPGGADNASAASGPAASPGPQRSLSALHGAGGSAGTPALPGAPMASAHPLPPGPLFSRFLCTPLAAACPSGAEQGDAAGAAASEREELLLLQSTAEQLRQTALQQEARIRADQDTIRELTGKLGRCESGLPRGLQDAGPRRDTMADGSWDSPALILELEDAVRALRDRIDRMEQELPAHVNLSAAPSPVPAVPTTLHSKMDELEGQLLAKVLVLEKERAALSHSSHRQQQEVEKELDGLQDRVAELEHGSSASVYPETFKISIPIRNNYMYARMRKALPELYAFTVCMWLRSRSGGTGQGTPFSYSVAGQANEIVLLETGHDPMELLINDKVAQLPLSLKDNIWHHICISWTTRDGLWSAYQDGELRGSGENLAAWHPIKPHGVFILGQEQDTLGGRFDATQAFVGDIAQFNLWDHILTPAQVLGIANCTGPLLGNVLPWENKLVETFGGAKKTTFDVCKGRVKA
ncbi:neuronal pentraxin receptor [Choloepus didactylus]|uniref:neuronal pentraxin receptor n=1 Tax=Choloepus didactylus TaxID=27675 RepID=UPI00189FA104|nr:neuronal pentraxin receptor [Choloepus didactylus]